MHVSIDVLHCTACMLYALSLVLRPFFSSGKIPDGENIFSPSVLLEGKRLTVVYVLLLCVCVWYKVRCNCMASLGSHVVYLPPKEHFLAFG